MNRKFSLLAGLVVMSLASCTSYHTDAGEMSELKGIYELQTMTRRDENGEDVNALIRDGIKAYLLIDGTQYGYYYYKDNSTPEYFDTIVFEYGIDEEASKDGKTYYKNVEYINGRAKKWLWDEKPGGLGGETKMGFNVKDHTLSYTISSQSPQWINSYHQIDYLYVNYKRVSDKTTFEDFKAVTNCNLEKPIPFMLKNLGHWMSWVNPNVPYSTQFIQNGDMYLMYLHFNEDYTKAEFYANYKGEPESDFHKIENCPVTYSMDVTEYGQPTLSLKVENTGYFTSENDTFSASLYDETAPTSLFNDTFSFYSVYQDEAPNITIVD